MGLDRPLADVEFDGDLTTQMAAPHPAHDFLLAGGERLPVVAPDGRIVVEPRMTLTVDRQGTG